MNSTNPHTTNAPITNLNKQSLRVSVHEDHEEYHEIPLNIIFEDNSMLSEDSLYEDLMIRSNFREAPLDFLIENMNGNSLAFQDDYSTINNKEFGLDLTFHQSITNKLSDSMCSDSDDFSYLCSSSSSSSSLSTTFGCSSLFSSHSESTTGSVASMCSSLSTPAMCFKELMSTATSLLDSYNQRHVSYQRSPSNTNKINCPVLPPSSRYCLEKGKHFQVLGCPSNIAKVIEESMLECSLLFSYDVNSTTWMSKCPQQKYFFDVHLFQCIDGKCTAHVVEIRRMSGCCYGFSEIYSKLHSLISRSHLIEVINEEKTIS